jgi:hypothetical protein
MAKAGPKGRPIEAHKIALGKRRIPRAKEVQAPNDNMATQPSRYGSEQIIR